MAKYRKYSKEFKLQAAKPDDIAGFTVRTLQIIGAERTVKNGLAVKKTVFVCCTDRTPKV